LQFAIQRFAIPISRIESYTRPLPGIRRRRGDLVHTLSEKPSMSADRFYCPVFEVGQASRLEGDEARHLVKVRRVAVGAEVEVFDGRGASAVAEVVQVGRDRVELRVKRLLDGLPPAALKLTLASAIPKGDRFDWLVEKATELGVDRVVPLITERSSVDPRSAKLDRLRRAIIEASKQCRRDELMTLEEPVRWETWLGRPDPKLDHRWLAHPGGTFPWAETPLVRGARVAVAIGPEGGFSDGEVALARSVGWETIDLTASILRVETAAMAVSAHLLIRSNGLPAT